MTSSTIASPTTNDLAGSTSTKPPSREPASRSKSSRLTRAKKEIAQHVPDISEEDEDDTRGETVEDASDSVPTVRLIQKPAAAKKTRKSSRAPSTRKSTRSASQLADSQRAGTRRKAPRKNVITGQDEEIPDRGASEEKDEHVKPPRSITAQKDLQDVGQLETPAQGDDITADAEAPNVQENEKRADAAIRKKTLPFVTPPTAKELEVSVFALTAIAKEKAPEPRVLEALEASTPTAIAKEKTPEPRALEVSPTMLTTIAEAKTPKAQTLPALSRIPFMPLLTLTDAELDMTVEEIPDGNRV